MPEDEEEYEEEEEEEYYEEEEEAADDEHAMDSKINALESELKDLRGGSGDGSGKNDPNDPNSAMNSMLRNINLDNRDLSPTSQAILQRGQVEDLKRVVHGLQSQLDAAVTAHRNDLTAFRSKEDDLLNRVRSFDDNSRLQKNQLLQIESKYEESVTKVAMLESQKHQLESDTREAQRQNSLKEQTILGLEDQRKSLEAQLFRAQEDLYNLTQECQSLHWKLKTEQHRAEQSSTELKESERVIAKLQTENQDLGMRIMSITGSTRIQAAEIESLQRDLKLATAEREESIKVAIAKQSLQDENTSIKVEQADLQRENSLLNGSLSNYKDEISRLETEMNRLQKSNEQLRRDMNNYDDERHTLRADNEQLRNLHAGQNAEIERLNNCLIEERKDRYSNFAGSNDYTRSKTPIITPSYGGKEFGNSQSGVDGVNTVARVVGPHYSDSRNAGGINPLQGPKIPRELSDSQAVATSRSKDPMNNASSWNTMYGSEYSPVGARGRQPLDHPAGGSSHFITRARSQSPGEAPVGRDAHLGPYGAVYVVDDQWNNAPRGMVSRRPQSGPNTSNPRANQPLADLETSLMYLNKERSQLEGILMKYPTNSAGKTLYDRKQKQTCESRLMVVEREISEIRQALRDKKGL